MLGAWGSNRGIGGKYGSLFYGFGHLQTDCPLPGSGISAEILRCYECGITFTFIIYSPHTLWECDHLPLQDLQLIAIPDTTFWLPVQSHSIITLQPDDRCMCVMASYLQVKSLHESEEARSRTSDLLVASTTSMCRHATGLGL